MDKSGKFLLPSPKFLKLDKTPAPTPHFLSPQGMLLPKEQQPPPMYGPRGSTVPPKFLGRQNSPNNPPNTRNQFERTSKFYCDPCEAEFHTSTDFKVHKSEHIACEIDNCSFRGHPSFMDTHIGLQHATGLYDQLKKLSSPEEIAQWRAERKKNYPTVAIVQQKQKAREQRMLRGEKLEGKKNRFGNREDRRQIRTDQPAEEGETGGKKNSRKHNRKRNRAGKQIAEREVKKFEEVNLEPMRKEEEGDEPAVCVGVKMFTGTGGMAGYRKVKKVESHALTGLLGMYGSDSEDEGESSEQELEQETVLKSIKGSSIEGSTIKPPPTQTNPETEKLANDETLQAVQTSHTAKNARQDTTAPPAPQDSVDEAPEDAPIAQSSKSPVQPQLSCDPSGAQDSDDEAPEEAPIAQSSKNPSQLQPSSCDPSAAQDSDDEAPEEAPIAKSSNIPDKPQPPATQKKDKKLPPKKKVRKSGLDYRTLRVGRQNTMLEKLLEPDIRHERNVLLQCIRFVVENNFFGIGSSTTTQSQS